MKTYLRICDGFQGILVKGNANNGIDFTVGYSLEGKFQHASVNHTMADGRSASLFIERGHFIYYPYWKKGMEIGYPQELWGDPESAFDHFFPMCESTWWKILASANAEIKCKLDDVLEMWAHTNSINLMKEV